MHTWQTSHRAHRHTTTIKVAIDALNLKWVGVPPLFISWHDVIVTVHQNVGTVFLVPRPCNDKWIVPFHAQLRQQV